MIDNSIIGKEFIGKDGYKCKVISDDSIIGKEFVGKDGHKCKVISAVGQAGYIK